MSKFVYFFGGGKADGNGKMKETLGGKGANLAEMASLGLPVPPGFTIVTDYCNVYLAQGRKFGDDLKQQVQAALKQVEQIMGMRYGDPEQPLLVSCRSGARSSMPGMMETVLNVGLSTRTIPGLIKKTGNERFVWDAYRRLIAMYSDVVMEKAEDIEVAEGQGIRQQLDRIMEGLKLKKGYQQDTDLNADDLKWLCGEYRKKVKEVLGRDFPDDPHEQLWGGIGAVFKSWNGRRAVSYRKIEGIPHEWGTACNVQSMVFGNLGNTSATGVAFTRNPATGENKFYGEWLVNAQGEDVVAGIRTPNPLNEATKSEQNRHLPSLEKEWPETYKELDAIRLKLERHFKDMQDIEFTVQEKKLFMLQCRSGKRTGTAALNMAMDMLKEGLIDEATAVQRVAPAQLDELLHPIVDPKAEKTATVLATGLPAGPGGASGEVVFTSADAIAGSRAGKKVILVREETNPEDVDGMRAAQGILTARGGMTSHAALVARGWGKCCIVGAGKLKIRHDGGKGWTLWGEGKSLKAGDVITLNGTRGIVYQGAVGMIDATENPRLADFMKLVDKFRKLGVRTNADTPEDARVARKFGAEGIGLFRTEHMFYGKGSEQPLFLLRKMILSGTTEERVAALKELAPFVKRDIKGTLEAMDGLPVTVRLLDPPLHEFVPHNEEAVRQMAEALRIDPAEVKRRGDALHEVNPMMGHRGVRLGITYPEITEMQVRAILEAASELKKAGKDPKPELMVPVTCDVSELTATKKIFDRVRAEVEKQAGGKVECLYGTMIEIPRACLLADRMAHASEFFSFGTNDLTQMTFGFSRDDTDRFMPAYLEQDLLNADPFKTIDTDGVGQLIEMAVAKGRRTRKELKIGICGEHGGDPASVKFCARVGLNYVSCSPFRVPIARLAAAHAALEGGK
jgi:pyruvate,orthophosphate dikinase